MTSAAAAAPSFSAARAASARRQLRIKQIEEEVKKAQTGTICALGLLLDLKDLKTGLHATRLAEWAVRVAEHIGVDSQALREIEIASLLHDIGKVGVPDSILLKPGKLTREEYEVVKKHSEYGWAILNSVPGLERTSLLVLHHHERFDGKGYPAGLVGDAIPLGARIVAVVDTFDAMLSNRPYRKGFSAEEVLDRLAPERGTQFDPEVLQHFFDIASRHLGEISEICEPSD